MPIISPGRARRPTVPRRVEAKSAFRKSARRGLHANLIFGTAKPPNLIFGTAKPCGRFCVRKRDKNKKFVEEHEPT